MKVRITFDPGKDAINTKKHGISLARTEDFDFDAANYRIDDREDYGEMRYRAISFIDARLYTLAFTNGGEVLRAISLRKATKYEESEYREGH